MHSGKPGDRRTSLLWPEPHPGPDGSLMRTRAYPAASDFVRQLARVGRQAASRIPLS